VGRSLQTTYLVLSWLEQAVDDLGRLSFSKRHSIKEHMFHQPYWCVFFTTSFTETYPPDSSTAYSNKNITGYTICKELSTLNATLYYTCNRSKYSICCLHWYPARFGWLGFMGYKPNRHGYGGRKLFPRLRRTMLCLLKHITLSPFCSPKYILWCVDPKSRTELDY
jgi:hypothetical protein